MNLDINPIIYLIIGTLLFVCLLLSLRLISTELELKSKPLSKEIDWSGKAPLEIVKIFDETHDVRSLVFKRVGGQPFPRFKPGQFLSFQIGDDKKTLRSYSISSSPADSETIQVSVKRLPNGVGSGWMHTRAVGDTVLAFPPSGYFVESDSSASHKIFIAGGIGITPFISMLLNKNSSRNEEHISLFYGMRSRKDMAFHDLLSHLSKRTTWFRYFPFLPEADPQWEGGVGNISVEYIMDKIKTTENVKAYLCGPAPMTDKIVPGLIERGIAKENVHLEKFVSPTTVSRDSIAARSLNLSWNGQKVQYDGKETILECLEKAEIAHPYACRVGVCGSCKSSVNGQFIQLTDAGLSEQEKKSGYCLPCVAFPLENMDIKVS